MSGEALREAPAVSVVEESAGDPGCLLHLTVRRRAAPRSAVRLYLSERLALRHRRIEANNPLVTTAD